MVSCLTTLETRDTKKRGMVPDTACATPPADAADLMVNAVDGRPMEELRARIYTDDMSLRPIKLPTTTHAPLSLRSLCLILP